MPDLKPNRPARLFRPTGARSWAEPRPRRDQPRDHRGRLDACGRWRRRGTTTAIAEMAALTRHEAARGPVDPSLSSAARTLLGGSKRGGDRRRRLDLFGIGNSAGRSLGLGSGPLQRAAHLGAAPRAMIALIAGEGLPTLAATRDHAATAGIVDPWLGPHPLPPVAADGTLALHITVV